MRVHGNPIKVIQPMKVTLDPLVQFHVDPICKGREVCRTFEISISITTKSNGRDCQRTYFITCSVNFAAYLSTEGWARRQPRESECLALPSPGLGFRVSSLGFRV
jgi:hypothetical protein